MNDIDFVLLLFLKHHGRLENPQKLAFEYAKELNHQILDTFKPFFKGFYSTELADILSTLRGCNFIDLTTFGTIIRYFLTDDGLFCALDIDKKMKLKRRLKNDS